MNRLIILLLLVLVTGISCSGDKKNTNNNQKPTQRVNPIKKEKAEITASEATTADNTESNTTKSDGATPAQLKKAYDLTESIDDEEIKSIDGKKLFKVNCSICHGFKGDMMINGAKDLTKSNIILEEAVAQIYFGKGLMTPYKGVLTDSEIIAVAQFSQSLRK